MSQSPQLLTEAVLTMPCELHAVRPTVCQAMDFLRGAGCREEDVLACEIALTEACNNAVQNSPQHLRSQRLPIRINCDAHNIRMGVADVSAAFEIPQECALPETEAESGRGLFLIRTLMDEVAYMPSGSHHVLEMAKTRRP